MNQTINDIVCATKDIIDTKTSFKLVKNESKFEDADGIIFLKPEVCAAESKYFTEILQYFFSLAEEYKIHITNIYALKTQFIYENNIFKKIYEPIYNYALLDSNKEPSLLPFYLEEKAQEYQSLLGGLALQKLGFTSEKILDIWKNGNISKIQDNMYSTEFIYNKSKILLVNGFVPSQMDAYNVPDTSIILFAFKTNNSFHALKNHFQGNIDSQGKAHKTMRQFFYDFQHQYKIDPIFQSRNGIHISENALEGKKEIDIFKKHILC